ncbi:MAG TPA: DUF1993 domain-containing protein [Rhizomicrobium sp.]|nr:DUF1993 domain-containing protein [Rhizomicrobium sp.]
MKITMYTMAVDTFVPGLESLSKLLDKGAAFAAEHKVDLLNARLAPDMFTLAQQVQVACYQATDGTSRLAGRGTTAFGEPASSFDGLKKAVAEAMAFVRAIPAAEFEGSETRDCSVTPPNAGIIIKMDGLLFLRSWLLPHFYFHLTTAYDILRHKGVTIGKIDFVSWMGPHIEQVKS